MATAAVRATGTPTGRAERIPGGRRPRLSSALVEAAGDAHEGIVLTSAVFYPHQVLGSDPGDVAASRRVAVEMEAALFVTASLHGAAAGAILAIDGNPLARATPTWRGTTPRDIVKEATERAVRAAFTALV